MVRVRRLVIATAVLLGLASVPALATSVPTARVVSSVRATGALFSRVPGGQPDMNSRHFCSASVLRSPTHDLILTAAHCVHGSGRLFDFVPGFHDGQAPYGVWTVTTVYLPVRWKRTRSQLADFAILRVARQDGRSIQWVVGGRALGRPDYTRRVTVAGYPAGTDGRPITCTNSIYRTSGYPTFDCDGYVGGVSGGPFIQGSSVVGVVGGLRQGGCVAHTSYSSPFGAGIAGLMQRAESGGPGDSVPATVPASGC